jgi:hypothetical protein
MAVAPPPATTPAVASDRGCPYAPRCGYVRPRCLEEAPALTSLAPDGRRAACHFPLG